MFVSAIVGRVVRVHDGDPDAKEMKEYTVAKRAVVLLNDRKVGLADLHEGDEVFFNNGGKNGYEKVAATRSKHSPFAVQSEKRDLGKPRLVQLVEPEVGTMTPRFVDADTPADEVGVQGSAIKHQGPVDPTKRDKTGHKETGTHADEGANSGPVGADAGEGVSTGEAHESGDHGVRGVETGHSGQKPGTHAKATHVPPSSAKRAADGNKGGK